MGGFQTMYNNTLKRERILSHFSISCNNGSNFTSLLCSMFYLKQKKIYILYIVCLNTYCTHNNTN